MTDVLIGRARRRTVDLGAELQAAADHLSRAAATLPPRIAIDVLAVPDDLFASSELTPGEIHHAATRLLDVVDQLDDYGIHAIACGIIGLTAARLYRLSNATATAPLEQVTA